MIMLIQFLASGAAIYFLVQYAYLTGIILENGYISALLFAVVLAVLNLVLGTILRFITTPIRMITFGIVTFAISVGMVYLTDILVRSVTIISPLTYVFIAIVISIINTLFRMFK